MFGLDSKESLKEIDTNIRQAFSKVKNELDEHLDAINQNTNEIQSNYEYLCELENKMDKIAQRLDQIQLLLEDKKPEPKQEYSKENISPLTRREQEVFMVLYTHDEELTYLDISRKLGLKEDSVKDYISSMCTKGIPIIKKFIPNSVLISLDSEFKSIQAKENILGIHEEVARQFV